MKRTLALTFAVLAGTSATALAASSPAVHTGSATRIGQTSAVLNGDVNPNGSATKYWFEWGLTNAYGSVSAVHTLKAGTTVVAVHVTATGLAPDVKYHFRLVAQNGSGTSNGADHTFKTKGRPLPVAETTPASSISTTSATINGVIDPNGQDAPTQFQWGTSANLGNTISGPTVSGSVPLQTISTTLPGLAPGRAFYYRVLVYRGSVGWIPASTLTFTTLPLSRPYAGLRNSTIPHHRYHHPYAFTTSGAIQGPFLASSQCSGTVAIRYFAGNREVKAAYPTVQSNCTFSQTTTFDHTFAPSHGAPRPRVQTLTVYFKFRGNSYLAPKQHTGHITLG